MFTVLVIPEGTDTVDGRPGYEPGELTWRTEPVPVMMGLAETADGHSGATFVGNLENFRRMRFQGSTWIVADLTYDISEIAAEFERLAESGMNGVSADVAEVWEDTGELDADGFPLFSRVSAEIVGATQLPMPAMDSARILVGEDKQLVPFAVTAALAPTVTSQWFDDPELSGPTPLTVTDEGYVSGHLALWDTCHTSYPDMCVSPPKGTDYSLFHTGAVKLGESEIPVGHITIGTGHAPIRGNAVEHYDNTGTCAADIRVGEDDYGIWVAGAAREGADLHVLRSASLSGDWRRINGNMELLAALAVNVPGFPIPRTQTMMVAGAQEMLTASGIVQEVEPESFEVQVFAALTEISRALDKIVGPEEKTTRLCMVTIRPGSGTWPLSYEHRTGTGNRPARPPDHFHRHPRLLTLTNPQLEV